MTHNGPATVRVGVTGHQHLKGADWQWVEAEMGRQLRARGPNLEGWTSLAAGADQLFARVVLQVGGALVGVVPLKDYDTYFAEPAEAAEYHRLLRLCTRVISLDAQDSGQAFLAAGQCIVDACGWLIAVWDGVGSQSLGSTGDVVSYARSLLRPTTILDPLAKAVRDA